MIINNKEQLLNYLEIDKYYYANNDRHIYIFKLLNKECYGNKAIHITENKYSSNFGRIGEGYNFDIRLATHKEIYWLDTCIKANKYVKPITELQYEIY